MKKLKAGWINVLKQDETYWQDLEQLALLGYRAMECGEELLQMGDEAIARFRGLGLSVLTVLADMKALSIGEYDSIIEKARRLGSNMATVYVCSVNASFWGEKPLYDRVMADYEAMEKAAARLTQEGITLCYHNHYQDFLESYNGVKAFDLMLANTERLKIELDTAWADNGMEDAARLIGRIAPRLAVIHVKDYRPGKPREEGGVHPIFVSVGNGVLDWIEILSAAQQAGVEWAIVEQDELHNLSPLQSLTASYLNLKETGLIE